MRNTYIYHALLAIFLSAIMYQIGRHSCNATTTYTHIGAPAHASTPVWIYLGGLLADITYLEELPDIQTIDRIGKELNITFVVPFQQHRYPKLGNMLCWPQDTKEELWRTYHEIFTNIGSRSIAGYIGFSNGGFFLTSFAQQKEFAVPLIVIGAAGQICTKNGPHNKLDLLISPADTWHYKHALKLYAASKDSHLTITLHEYDGGHIVPYNTLHTLLTSICTEGR